MTSYVVGAGQTSSGITLNTGDTMLVLSGGLAIEDVVGLGATLTVQGGEASADTINNGGLLVVSAGIADSDTINSGGSLVVAAGDANDGFINNGGSLVVSRGDAFFETVNSGGALTVATFGMTQDDTVESGGRIVVSGGAGPAIGGGGPHAMVISGGLLDIASGGSLNEAVDFRSVGGGRLDIDGATMPTQTISGFAPGDSIDLTAIRFNNAGSAKLLAGNVLQISENAATYDLNFGPNQNCAGEAFYLANDAAGGTLITEAAAQPPFGSLQLGISAFTINAGGWTSQDVVPRMLGNFNADGRADIVAFGNTGVYLGLANADGTFEGPNRAMFGPGPNLFNFYGSDPSAGGWTDQNEFPRELASLNGFGHADIFGFGAAGVYVSVDAGSSYITPNLMDAAFGFAASAGGWISQDQFPRELADLNGDRRADIVGFGEAGVYVALDDPAVIGHFQNPALAFSGFGFDPSAGGWTSQNLFPRELADVNGDGHADIVAFGDAGAYVALGNGDGSFRTPILAYSGFGFDPSAGGWTSNDAYPRELADVNGDGRADIVAFGAAGAYVSLANADGTFQSPSLALAALGTDNGFNSNDIYPRELADVNGDGRADIVAFAGDGVYVALANPNGTFQAPMLENFEI